MTSGADRQSRVVAIMPARNSARTLEDTFRAIPPGVLDHIVLVDNASRDDTVVIAERLGIQVVRHPVDRGFGGSIKTLLRTALAAGADYIVELHPDNQYDPRDIPVLLAKARSAGYAMVIGSRFLPPGRALEGGMPHWRYLSNRVLSLMNSAMLGVWLSEYHSGMKVLNARWVRTLDLSTLSDDFNISFQLISQAVMDGWPLAEVPASCRYFDEASSNPLRGSIVYALGTLGESAKVLAFRAGLRSAGRRRA
jgi:glycosyltransferase involved in cell wall biosynthesis